MGIGKRGITLLEVLVAVVVIAIGVVGALGAMATAVGAVATAGDRLRALGRLEDELVALRAEEQLQGGLTTGSHQGSWPWPAQATWDATVAAAGSSSFVTVTLAARWGAASRTHLVRLTTAAAEPAESGS